MCNATGLSRVVCHFYATFARTEFIYNSQIPGFVDVSSKRLRAILSFYRLNHRCIFARWYFEKKKFEIREDKIYKNFSIAPVIRDWQCRLEFQRLRYLPSFEGLFTFSENCDTHPLINEIRKKERSLWKFLRELRFIRRGDENLGLFLPSKITRKRNRKGEFTPESCHIDDKDIRNTEDTNFRKQMSGKNTGSYTHPYRNNFHACVNVNITGRRGVYERI